MSQDIDFDEVCNYYGSLKVFTQDGKHYWGIEDYDGTIGETQIPDYLYKALERWKSESMCN